MSRPDVIETTGLALVPTCVEVICPESSTFNKRPACSCTVSPLTDEVIGTATELTRVVATPLMLKVSLASMVNVVVASILPLRLTLPPAAMLIWLAAIELPELPKERAEAVSVKASVLRTVWVCVIGRVSKTVTSLKLSTITSWYVVW